MLIFVFVLIQGYASGSFGPTTAGRMDSYVAEFQAAGGSMVMLAKGNRSSVVTKACKEFGGFYLGSIGGPAAILARDCIKQVSCCMFSLSFVVNCVCELRESWKCFLGPNSRAWQLSELSFWSHDFSSRSTFTSKCTQSMDWQNAH